MPFYATVCVECPAGPALRGAALRGTDVDRAVEITCGGARSSRTDVSIDEEETRRIVMTTDPSRCGQSLFLCAIADACHERRQAHAQVASRDTRRTMRIGAPQYRVDPFMAQTALPNKWSMQQVRRDPMSTTWTTSWFATAVESALPIELGGRSWRWCSEGPGRRFCCVRVDRAAIEMATSSRANGRSTLGGAPAITRSGRFSCRRHRRYQRVRQGQRRSQ
jgi:hypothetical protein